MNRTADRQAMQGAPLAVMLLFLTSASLDAAGLPQQWVDEALDGADDRVHPVIKNHMRSQLDWRSYYLDGRQTRQRLLPSDSVFQSSAPP